MFDFAKDCAVKPKDFDKPKKPMLINGFLYQNSITLIYSPPKQGKSWLSYAIAKTCSKSEHIESIYYLDMDNSFTTMKDRGFDKHLFEIEGLTCMTKATIQNTPFEKLEEIASCAKSEAFSKVIFVIDTIKDFIEFDKNNQANSFMRLLVTIRDAGATLLVLHHSNKNEKGISGSQAFINSSDNIYSLRQTSKEDTKLFFHLAVTHARGVIEDKDFSVDTKTLELTEEDDPSVMLSEEEKEFVEKIKSVLYKEKEGINQSALLQKLSLRKDSKKHLAMLKEYIGVFWKVEKVRNINLFKLK